MNAPLFRCPLFALLSLSLQGFRNQHHKGQTNSVRLMNFFTPLSLRGGPQSKKAGRPLPLFASTLFGLFRALLHLLPLPEATEKALSKAGVFTVDWIRDV